MTVPNENDFRDPQSGEINRYAMRAYQRLLALAFYQFHWRSMGHERAAAATCERFGHELRGGRCDRCAAPLSGG